MLKGNNDVGDTMRAPKLETGRRALGETRRAREVAALPQERTVARVCWVVYLHTTRAALESNRKGGGGLVARLSS